MNRSIYTILLCAAVSLVGCGSERGPSFRLSDSSEELSSFAKEKLQGELEAGFGTPTSLVVWPKAETEDGFTGLEIDFGQYSGIVTKVGPRPGTLRIGDSSGQGLAAASDLASASQLTELRGAAVVIMRQTTTAPTEGKPAGEAEAPKTYRVASYDPETRELTVMNEDGTTAQMDVSEGDTVQVLGSALQHGRNLYLRHCMHCHGVSGNGAGPTAQYFRVKPRDYRKGTIKFTSTKSGVRPSRNDLFRIVKLGVPGTYMPSFMLLPDDDVKKIVEYVRWLSMRGETERGLNAWLSTSYSKTAVSDSEQSTSEIRAEFDAEWAADSTDKINENISFLQQDWETADKPESIVKPMKKDDQGKMVDAPRVPYSAESVARGRKIFLGTKAKCLACHGETGRGNGPSTDAYNDIPGGEPGVKSDKPGLFDDWGNIVKPRDLTAGVFRGGRRPIDIYRRIHTGIKGTPMQGFGGTLDGDEIWDVVNYVLSVPFKEKTKTH